MPNYYDLVCAACLGDISLPMDFNCIDFRAPFEVCLEGVRHHRWRPTACPVVGRMLIALECCATGDDMSTALGQRRVHASSVTKSKFVTAITFFPCRPD